MGSNRFFHDRLRIFHLQVLSGVYRAQYGSRRSEDAGPAEPGHCTHRPRNLCRGGSGDSTLELRKELKDRSALQTLGPELLRGGPDSDCGGDHARKHLAPLRSLRLIVRDWAASGSRTAIGQLTRQQSMHTVMQFLQTTFSPLVLIFTVSNLAAMGLQVKMPDVIVAFRNKKSLALIFVWGWVLGPAVGYLITKALPLAEPYVIVVLLMSLAPCAPFLQQMVGKARGDMGFAGALIPLVAVGTVVLMPLMAPLLIKGLTISTWALAKPLLLTILLPLLLGAGIRHYAATGADKIFPAVKGLALLSTLLTIVWCLLIYGRGMLNTAGELALLSMTLFMVGMALITYRFGFGMKQNQRSVMALGMGTRNVAAVLAAALAIPNADPRIVVMTIMWTLWSVVLAAIAAKIFAKQAGGIAAGAAA